MHCHNGGRQYGSPASSLADPDTLPLLLGLRNPRAYVHHCQRLQRHRHVLLENLYRTERARIVVLSWPWALMALTGRLGRPSTDARVDPQRIHFLHSTTVHTVHAKTLATSTSSTLFHVSRGTYRASLPREMIRFLSGDRPITFAACIAFT